MAKSLSILFLAVCLGGRVFGSQHESTPERDFWSFKVPVAQASPNVKDTRWPRQRIDYFVLARLEREGLRPTPEASRRTLIRRAYYDLTGLPPTPEELDEALRASGPQAYVDLIDRLLASPRFGERLASLWLPLARYAEDQAHQVGSDTKFFYPNAWRYREWVINAFNRDLPYDKFIELQLAADKLDEPGELAALGFLGLGPKYYNRGRLEVQADEWEDGVDTVTRTVLGLTVACARCHDHKFEPITMQDYYGLAGVFASTKLVNKSESGKEIKKDAEAARMPADTLHIVEDGEVKNLNVFLRGDVTRAGPEAPRGFPAILSNAYATPFAEGSGRKELAEAITSPQNPLTARVIVNRLWAVVFGQPMVSTPSNFGRSGQLPTHPELLDDLAVRFMAGGWSVKQLVREWMLSSTYRQSSESAPAAMQRDPSNQFLGRAARKRLSIEQWRDSVLAMSGQLEFEGGKSRELDAPENRRRTVHARISRLQLNDTLLQFDYPDANVHAEKRSASTTPMQKLFMLNSPFAMAQAKAFAARLHAGRGKSDNDKLKIAYRHVYSREPDKDELLTALQFLREPGNESFTRWEQLAQTLMASNELLYVD